MLFLGFVSTFVYFFRDALLLKLYLTKSLCFSIFLSAPLSLFRSFILCLLPCLSSLSALYLPASWAENGHCEILVSSIQRVSFLYVGAPETLSSVLCFKNIILRF